MHHPPPLPLQVAFLTGQSRPSGSALTPSQTAFLHALPVPTAGRVTTNFPYLESASDEFAPVPLLVASVRNARQYLAARRAGFAPRHRPAVEALLARAEHTLFLAGSCGLELFNALALPADLLRRVTIFAYGPVARRRPDCACVLVQGRRDWLSRCYFRSVDARVDAGHMDYLAVPAVFDLAADLVRRLTSGSYAAAGPMPLGERHPPSERAPAVTKKRRFMNNLPLIDLAAPPFCGHLHPILGMARRLSREYRVRVVSTELGLTRARAAGFDGVAVMAGCDEEIARIVGGPRAARSNPFALHAQLRANLRLMGRFRDEMTALYHREPPDLLIADITLPFVGPVAQARGIPWWTSHPAPCTAEPWHGDGVPAYLGGWSPRPGVFGALRDRVGNGLTRLFKRTLHALHRREFAALGFPSAYRSDGTEAAYSPECVLALAWPELEFPRRWPPAFRFVGPVVFTPPGRGGGPTFAPGKRHVLVTFGTHSEWLKDRAAEAVRRAAEALPEVVFHFSDGKPEGRVETASAGNFQRVAYVPYDDCLPRYDLVVHHGGTGILYACLHHGKPAVVFPVDYDQFDQAARLTHAGLARRLRTLAGLADAVRAALADDGLRKRCEAFRAKTATAEPPEERIAALVRSRLRADADAAEPQKITKPLQ